MVLMRGSYLVCSCVRAWLGSLSWQCVKSMSWIGSVRGGGAIGVCVWFGAPIMHKFFGRSLAWHWHVMCGHVHLRSQFGIVCWGGICCQGCVDWSVGKTGCICKLVMHG